MYSHDDPAHGRESDIAPDDTGRLKVVTDRALADNVVDKVVDGFFSRQVFVAPWRIGTPRGEKGIDDPGNQNDVVGIYGTRKEQQRAGESPIVGHRHNNNILVFTYQA